MGDFLDALVKKGASDEKIAEAKNILDNKVKVMCDNSNGNIPVIAVSGKCLAEAWENSMIALYEHGCLIRTQYDRKKGDEFIDPPSKDSSLTFVVENPFSDPMLTKCFPAGLADLEEYRQEVLDGVKDNWMRDKNDPADKRWEYTYHERLFSYKVPGIEKPINQIEELIKGLAKSPYSRRCQAITWQPWEDLNIGDPACLQSIWARILEEKGEYKLNMNIRFRSRDSFKAAFMNAFAFVHLHKYVADEISNIIGKEVKLGRYVDQSDSYHIYGQDIKEFEEKFVNRFMTNKFEKRTWTLDYAKPIFEEAKPGIAEKIKAQNERYTAEKLARDMEKHVVV